MIQGRREVQGRRNLTGMRGGRRDVVSVCRIIVTARLLPSIGWLSVVTMAVRLLKVSHV
jgi:hypothetical protein